MPKFGDIIDAAEAEWQDAVLRWKSAVDSLDAAVQDLWNHRDIAISLGTDEFNAWQAQLDSALRTKTAIEMLQEGLAATSTWAKQTLGLSGLNRMGFIPLIPVAIIVGSISAVTATVYALYSYNSALQAKWDYINNNPGTTPAQVEQILGASSPVPLISDVKSMAVWIAVAGMILFFGPDIVRELRKARK